jgi:hypothetical protein
VQRFDNQVRGVHVHLNRPDPGGLPEILWQVKCSLESFLLRHRLPLLARCLSHARESSCSAIQPSSASSRPLPDVPVHSRFAESEMLLSYTHSKGQGVRVPIQPIFRGAEFLRGLGRREQPIAVRAWLSLLAGEQPTEQERIKFGDLATQVRDCIPRQCRDSCRIAQQVRERWHGRGFCCARHFLTTTHLLRKNRLFLLQ